MNRVERWIDNNFYTKGLIIKDLPLFPLGKVITDKNNDKMLVYLDIIKDEVEYKFL